MKLTIEISDATLSDELRKKLAIAFIDKEEIPVKLDILGEHREAVIMLETLDSSSSSTTLKAAAISPRRSVVYTERSK